MFNTWNMLSKLGNAYKITKENFIFVFAFSFKMCPCSNFVIVLKRPIETIERLRKNNTSAYIRSQSRIYNLKNVRCSDGNISVVRAYTDSLLG